MAKVSKKAIVALLDKSVSELKDVANAIEAGRGKDGASFAWGTINGIQLAKLDIILAFEDD